MAVRNVGAGLSRTAVATAALMVAIATTIGGILSNIGAGTHPPSSASCGRSA
ncbi:MAG: hypothetical protein ACREWE_08635 [Gammaproteobacteria bacterium]